MLLYVCAFFFATSPRDTPSLLKTFAADKNLPLRVTVSYQGPQGHETQLARFALALEEWWCNVTQRCPVCSQPSEGFVQILTAQLVVDLDCLHTNAAGTVSGTEVGLVCCMI